MPQFPSCTVRQRGACQRGLPSSGQLMLPPGPAFSARGLARSVLTIAPYRAGTIIILTSQRRPRCGEVHPLTSSAGLVGGRTGTGTPGGLQSRCVQSQLHCLGTVGADRLPGHGDIRTGRDTRDSGYSFLLGMEKLRRRVVMSPALSHADSEGQ